MGSVGRRGGDDLKRDKDREGTRFVKKSEGGKKGKVGLVARALFGQKSSIWFKKQKHEKKRAGHHPSANGGKGSKWQEV